MTTRQVVRDPDGPSWFSEGDPIWSDRPNGPRFGQLVWNGRTVVRRENSGERTIDFATIPHGYRRDSMTLLSILAQPTHPGVIRAGVVRRAKPSPFSQIYTNFVLMRVVAVWGDRRGLSAFAHWKQADADALVDDLRHGRHRDGSDGIANGSIRKYVELLKLIREFAPMLEAGFSFVPWGARSPATVARVERRTENLTDPLGWGTWAPAVAASWAFVDKFSTDIIEALRLMRSLPPRANGLGGGNAWNVLAAWEASGGRVPLHTGFGRASGNRNSSRGKPNIALLCRLIGINNSIFNTSNESFRQEAVDMVYDLASTAGRHVFGGVYTPTVAIDLGGARAATWIEELGGGEIEYFASALRASCYMIIASLSGMRDGEIQALTRDAITTRDGLPALLSRQYKGRDIDGQERGWWAPRPVMRAVEVLAKLSDHPTHLFARRANNVGVYQSDRDVARLIEAVNGDPATRPGRGRGLGLDHIDMSDVAYINATNLRRSYSVYAVTRSGAELGLGIQLGHSAWRMTTGYGVDGQEQVAKRIDEGRGLLMRKQASELIRGRMNVAGHPAAQINQFRAQVISDPTRADRVIASVADRWHLGLTNDCMFHGATAVCDPDRPHLGDHLCVGGDCANALFTEEHVGVLVDAIGRIDGFLDKGRGSPALVDRMRRERASLARLRRSLTGSEDMSEGRAVAESTS